MEKDVTIVICCKFVLGWMDVCCCFKFVFESMMMMMMMMSCLFEFLRII